MDRIEQSKKNREALFQSAVSGGHSADPELYDILNHFLFGEVFEQGTLGRETRELITLAVLTTNQTLPQLRAHVGAALHIGLAPVAIKEAIYQCAPYIGFPKTLNAVREANEEFASHGILLPLEPQGQVEEETRFAKGLQVQTEIFGDVIRQNRENAPQNQKHIQDYLSAFCFGDFYTRGGLELKTRELLTVCIVSALGGCENQVKAHVQGNLRVGNSKETLISAITYCLPYMGFPRTLNALACINAVAPE